MVEGTQPYIATWCPVCDKRVSDKGKDTERLLKHFRRNHCKISLSQRPDNNNSQDNLEQILKLSSCTKQTTATTVSNKRQKDNTRIYSTRVDTWRSHDEKKTCPQCKKVAVPTLHTRRHKLTTSHITAICLLGKKGEKNNYNCRLCDRCWPFCFIPLMKRTKKIRMICPACGYVYGTYEYKNNNLAPSCQPDSENSQVRLPSSSLSSSSSSSSISISTKKKNSSLSKLN